MTVPGMGNPVRLFVPPREFSVYQPVFYSALWLLALWLFILGHVWGETIVPSVWVLTVFSAPPLALLSLWVIHYRPGIWRYWGYCLRLLSDLIMAIAMTVYDCLRWNSSVPYVIAVLSTALVYVLVWSDTRTMVLAEQVAAVLRRQQRLGGCE